MTADEPTVWGRIRRRLGMGPTRAELVAEAGAWRRRRDAAEKQSREAHVRAKAAEKRAGLAKERVEFLEAVVRRAEARARMAEARARRAEEGMRGLVDAALNEPDRVEGCAKVRFHQQAEAEEWAAAIARRTGESPDAYEAYRCRDCPRSPVTMQRYWHARHLSTQEGQASKQTRIQVVKQERQAARRDGKLLEQRVDPTVLAKLRKLGGDG